MNFDTTAPLGIALLGLLMGMRHATDPDHVIAVTTIVSRELHLTAASRVGIVWGIGHTLTVLAVGAAIIVFKIAIPIRLGLAMEFAVAVVLILLGVGAFASRSARACIEAGFKGQSARWNLLPERRPSQPQPGYCRDRQKRGQKNVGADSAAPAQAQSHPDP